MSEIAPVEPHKNPNAKLIVDPPPFVRWVLRRKCEKATNPDKRAARRAAFEGKRKKAGAPHMVEYFHQLDDPYSHLAAQVLAKFAAQYDIVIKPYLIQATGGRHQPRLQELAVWARRDAQSVAPYYGLSLPQELPQVPDSALQAKASDYLASLSDAEFVAQIEAVSTALWNNDTVFFEGKCAGDGAAACAAGSAHLQASNHYSGATFHYGGEWYWGVDRLFYLEQRLRDLSAGGSGDYLVIRPEIDVGSIDASAFELDFYPSLNSPYTSIIFDKTIALKNACQIKFNHKPVLPMIMRGVAATSAKGDYIFFDTKREGETLGVGFGPIHTPIGEPTRQAYALLPLAFDQGKDEALMKSLLDAAWRDDLALHKKKNLRLAVERAGLDWAEAETWLGRNDWKDMVALSQHEMVEGMGLWGVPSYRLSGPDGEDDLEVWGQDRLWLIAAEITRRAAALSG